MAASSLLPTFVTLLVILAGLLGAIWTDDIKSAFPFVRRFHSPELGWRATGFWLTVFATAVLFFIRQTADDAAREDLIAESHRLREAQDRLAGASKSLVEAQSKILEQAQLLERMIRTLPPRNFLDAFAALFVGVAGAEIAALGSPEPPFMRERVDSAIRIVLRSIAALAKIFDGDRAQARYAANVMVYRPTETLTPAQRHEIDQRLIFCEDETLVEHLKGVLDLDPALSAHSEDGKSYEPDPAITAIALPVPRRAKSEQGKYRVLPGAPLSLLENIPEIHTEFGRLCQWCEEHGDFTDSVKAELTEYFSQQRAHMQSFISLPISELDNPNQPFAVLNIHCQQAGMLRDHPDAAAQFVAIVKPLQVILAKLLACRREASEGPEAAH